MRFARWFAAGCLGMGCGVPVAAGVSDALSAASLTAPMPDRVEVARRTATQAPPFVIALEGVGNDDVLRESVAPLAAALRERYPERDVDVRVIPSGAFVESVREMAAPFVIASAATTVRMMLEDGVVPLTAREVVRRGRIRGNGGLLVARAERNDLTDLASLRGTVVAVQGSQVFGVWDWLRGRLLEEDLGPDDYFKFVLWRAFEMPEVLDAVLSGRADVGLLSACEYERLVEDGLLEKAALKPVALMPAQGAVCLASTPGYADWIFSYASGVDGEEVRRVAAVLFSMPAGKGVRWGVTVDVAPVRALMEKLHYGPFAYLDERGFVGLVRRWGGWMAGVAAALCLLLLHALRSNHLVRVKTRELRRALDRTRRLEAQARATRERLSELERRGVVSQLSSMFAHEVKQPLAAVANYAAGLKFSLGRGTPEAREILDEIGREAARAADIVERVRAYAKGRNKPLESVDLTQAVLSAAKLVEQHATTGVPVDVEIDGEASRAIVAGDALELELLALNLIRNAAKAARAAGRRARVFVRLAPAGGHWSLSVSDTGARLSDEALRRIADCGAALSGEGLGIGLSLCRGIAERHAGSLKFTRSETGGLLVHFVVPKRSDEGES